MTFCRVTARTPLILAARSHLVHVGPTAPPARLPPDDCPPVPGMTVLGMNVPGMNVPGTTVPPGGPAEPCVQWFETRTEWFP